MAAVSLFWDTNMAALTLCENTLLYVVDLYSYEPSLYFLYLSDNFVRTGHLLDLCELE